MSTEPEIPVKYADYPDNFLVGSDTIAWVFGIERANVSRWMKRGDIPQPDSTGMAPNRRSKNFWKLDTIRKFIGEQDVPI